MKNKTIIIAAFLIIGGIIAFAQSFDVDYLDGTVEVKTAKGWSAVAIGDTLDPAASIRLSKSGSIELSRGSLHLTILKDGTYALADLARANEKNKGANVGSALIAKLRIIASPGSQATTSTTAGARAGEAGRASASNNVTWMSGDEDKRALIDEKMNQGDYAGAIPLLQDALDESALIDEEQEIKFKLATAYYGNDQIARAYRIIAKTAPSQSAGYYPDFVILKAEILLDSLLFKEGQDALKTFIASKPGSGYLQLAYYLSAQCAKGIGDSAAAAAALKAGLAIDPESETGKEIKAMMGT